MYIFFAKDAKSFFARENEVMEFMMSNRVLKKGNSFCYKTCLDIHAVIMGIFSDLIGETELS